MKTKLYDNGRITIQWDSDEINILDAYNSFEICIAKDMAKYFVYCTEILYKISKGMRVNALTFHRDIHNGRPFEYIEQGILNQFRRKGFIHGNYMDINRKDLILYCFKKCFRMKQEKLELKDVELKDIDLQNMPITALIYIKKGLL